MDGWMDGCVGVRMWGCTVAKATAHEVCGCADAPINVV